MDYAVPATNPIRDVAGNEAAAFTDFAVDNNSTVEGIPPVPASAEVLAAGDNLTLTFNEDLDIAADKSPPGQRLHRQGRRRRGGGAIRVGHHS